MPSPVTIVGGGLAGPRRGGGGGDVGRLPPRRHLRPRPGGAVGGVRGGGTALGLPPPPSGALRARRLEPARRAPHATRPPARRHDRDRQAGNRAPATPGDRGNPARPGAPRARRRHPALGWPPHAPAGPRPRAPAPGPGGPAPPRPR